MKRIISGIQQVGIGVENLDEAFAWYRKVFGTDVVVFRDSAEATLMQRYTGDVPHRRHAMLIMNMKGGGGFELWQFADRQPQKPISPICVGDTGIFAVKVKSPNVAAAFNYHKQCGVEILGDIQENLLGLPHYYLKDPYGNIFEVEESKDWFMKTSFVTGAVSGVVLGVNCVAKAAQFYQEVLGYDVELFDDTGYYPCFKNLPGGDQQLRRVLLSRSEDQCGHFAKLLGATTVELVEVPGKKSPKIYEGRFWGDAGFIHACFDINGMGEHERICKSAGFPLTVNSSKSFEMGAAAGHFAYNEDPDGTLIEYVETHKVPVIKKIGLYLDLKKRDPQKHLPDWMVKCLSLARVKA